jgi:adenylate kinase
MTIAVVMGVSGSGKTTIAQPPEAIADEVVRQLKERTA